MQIAHLSYFYWPIKGGQETYIATLNGLLKAEGHGVSVFQPWRPGVELAPEVVATPPCPTLERLLDRWSLWNWGWHVFNLQLLRKRGLLRKADRILSHYAVHTPPVWDMTGKVIVVSHGIEWAREKPGLEDRVRERIARRALFRFPTVANDTDYFRSLGLNLDPGSTPPFSEVAPGRWYIPNCVDTDFFCRTSGLPELHGRTIVLVPRIITRDRGVDLAIRAFGLLARNNGNLWLYIAGGPTEGRHFAYCQSLARQLGVEDRVVFLGQVPRERMPAVYSSAAVTLIPSRRREGTSLSAVESMACGTPVVSTAVGGLQDLPTLKAGINPEELARCVEEALRQRNEIGQQQAAFVRQHLNIQNWGTAWLKVLNAGQGQSK